MSKPYDASLKWLFEVRPDDWIALQGLPPGQTSIVDADLSTVSAFADRLIRVDAPTGSYLVHNELESGKDTVGVADRLYHYGALADYKFGLPVVSTVFLLGRKSNSPRLTGRLIRHAPNGKPYLTFRYTVVRVWQLDAEAILRSGGLATLPFAPIADVPMAEGEAIFNRVRDRIEREATSDTQYQELMTATSVLMGLHYEKPFIAQLMQGVRTMRESVTWEIISREGEIKGERDAVLRVGARRFGTVPPAVQERLAQISSLEKLQAMLDRVLDVASWDELLQTA